MNDDGSTVDQDAAGGAADVYTFLRMCDTIRDNPRTRVFTGNELKAGHQANSCPVDFVGCMTYAEDTSIYEAFRTPAFSTVAILIDNFSSSSGAVNNTYEVTTLVHRAARFGSGTLLGSLETSLRVDPTTHANHARREENMPAARQILDLPKSITQGNGRGRRITENGIPSSFG